MVVREVAWVLRSEPGFHSDEDADQTPPEVLRPSFLLVVGHIYDWLLRWRGKVFRAATASEMRYFVTFACYGGHLHGHESGSVDPKHNAFAGRLVEPDPQRLSAERRRMLQPPYGLDADRRAVVLAALRQHSAYRKWGLLAAHVRTNHVHVVVEAEARPERVMNEFKAYASRELNRLGFDEPGRKRWARHGSARWLWNDLDVRSAIQYVTEEQGEPMDFFVAEEFRQ